MIQEDDMDTSMELETTSGSRMKFVTGQGQHLEMWIVLAKRN